MKAEHKIEVGRRIRQFRTQLGKSQIEMSQYLDVGRANFSRIEGGDIYPNLSILKTFQDLFKLNLNWVINNKEEMILRETSPDAINFGKYDPEIRELLLHMEKVPFLKHAILSEFQLYKAKNKDLIDSYFKKQKE
jgi:transcriptional regulator with XRE-family HTH domain